MHVQTTHIFSSQSASCLEPVIFVILLNTKCTHGHPFIPLSSWNEKKLYPVQTNVPSPSGYPNGPQIVHKIHRMETFLFNKKTKK